MIKFVIVFSYDTKGCARAWGFWKKIPCEGNFCGYIKDEGLSMDFSGDVVSCVAGAEMSDPRQGQGIVIKVCRPVVFFFLHLRSIKAGFCGICDVLDGMASRSFKQ